MINEPSGPDAAYANAPEVGAEITWIAQRATSRPTGPEADREFRLRRAAALDRIALHETATATPLVATEAITTAVRAAEDLAEYDAEHGSLTFRGAELAGAEDFRAYVREEYRAWHHPQVS
ncbi:hypothetical protein [Streptomyces sp. BPTC-684]|uniref:hypothetical protein n=1 Tax=Streptomyces sp. BPTC-684 TaxID=3043734 RepID=UPI0024B17D69|nr:hypothetical protein [Streptomyces sp. BPTC-684]WHM37430.1 hypothetical protein QIY60_11285 [Streptomyces sp. BPTC-684]